MLKIKGLGNIDWDLDEMVPSHQEDFALNFLLKLDRKRLEWGHVTYSHGEVNYGEIWRDRVYECTWGRRTFYSYQDLGFPEHD